MILPGRPVAFLRYDERTYDGDFRFRYYDAPYGPPATWYGSSPWIDQADELTNYVSGSTTATKVAWLCDPVQITGILTVATSGTYVSANSTNISIWVHDTDTFLRTDADLVADALATGSTFGLGGWELASDTYPVTPAMATAAESGRLIVIAGIGLNLRLSMLRVEADPATRPGVRLLGRGDGINSGSNRLIGTGTPQSSVRLLGSL